MLIVTGLAGAGKSFVLNTLEDIGYYCVDNLPTLLLEPFLRDFASRHHQPVAVALDARNPQGIVNLAAQLKQFKRDYPLQILFLTADNQTLVRRYNESRRPHPLHTGNQAKSNVLTAIEEEKRLLGELNNLADIIVDTSTYNTAQLREKIIRLLSTQAPQLMLTIQSFGFKHGIPSNADFIFDVRFLPNPYWEADIRPFSGTQQPIIDWLDAQPQPQQFIANTAAYLQNWLPQFVQNQNRAYLNICIGCTGGQHRSVYVAEGIGKVLQADFPSLQIEHRDMREYQAP